MKAINKRLFPEYDGEKESHSSKRPTTAGRAVYSTAAAGGRSAVLTTRPSATTSAAAPRSRGAVSASTSATSDGSETDDDRGDTSGPGALAPYRFRDEAQEVASAALPSFTAPIGEVSYTSSAKSFGEILTGSAGAPAGQNRLIIDPVQRPYSWGPKQGAKVAHDFLHIFKDGIAKYSFGEATVHKASDSHPDCYILNGQQRIITVTILLSVLRHLTTKRFPALDLTKIQAMFPQAVFHFQESRGELREIPRIEVRQLQQEFFATYISPAVDNLGCFWDEHGNLQKHLAGRDTINGRFMDVAHAIKQVLTGAMGRNQRRLFDGYQEIADFADQILNKTNLAWSVHVAGGNSYKCSIYQQSNASQMCITTVDMLKAALLSSLSDEESNEFANTWDQYLLRLNGFTLASLRHRTMFEHIFHVIHMILKSSGTTKDFDKSLDLLAAFTADDIAISQQPERFMEDFFIPVAEAMDRIFNWRELKLQDSEEDSMTLRLLDSIKTSCRSLIRIGDAIPGRIPLSYWLGSCAVPFFMQLWPKKTQSATARRASLKTLAIHMQALERRIMWQLLSSSHASQIRNILFAGGQVTESGTDAKLHVKGALRTLTPADTISTDWNDTDDVIVALQLTPSEQSQLVDSILKLRYERRAEIRAKVFQVIMMYDDELRNPIDPSTNPWNKIEAYDYDVELEQADCEAELSHLVPQTVQKNSRWARLWPQEGLEKQHHEHAKHLLGNLAVLTNEVNGQLGNSALLPETLEAYRKGTMRFVSTDKIQPEAWDLEHLLSRHSYVHQVVARRLMLPWDGIEAKLPRLSAGNKLINVPPLKKKRKNKKRRTE